MQTGNQKLILRKISWQRMSFLRISFINFFTYNNGLFMFVVIGALKGVMRVGVLAKGLLLHERLDVNLVVLCHGKILFG